MGTLKFNTAFGTACGLAFGLLIIAMAFVIADETPKTLPMFLIAGFPTFIGAIFGYCHCIEQRMLLQFETEQLEHAAAHAAKIDLNTTPNGRLIIRG